MVLRLPAVGEAQIERPLVPAGEDVADDRPEKLLTLAEVTVLHLDVRGQSQHVESGQAHTFFPPGVQVPDHGLVQDGRGAVPGFEFHPLLSHEGHLGAVHQQQIGPSGKRRFPDVRADLRGGSPLRDDLPRSLDDGEEFTVFPPCPGEGDGSPILPGTEEADPFPVKSRADPHRVARLGQHGGPADGGQRGVLAPPVFVVPGRRNVKFRGSGGQNREHDRA